MLIRILLAGSTSIPVRSIRCVFGPSEHCSTLVSNLPISLLIDASFACISRLYRTTLVNLCISNMRREDQMALVRREFSLHGLLPPAILRD